MSYSKRFRLILPCVLVFLLVNTLLGIRFEKTCPVIFPSRLSVPIDPTTHAKVEDQEFCTQQISKLADRMKTLRNCTQDSDCSFANMPQKTCFDEGNPYKAAKFWQMFENGEEVVLNAKKYWELAPDLSDYIERCETEAALQGTCNGVAFHRFNNHPVCREGRCREEDDVIGICEALNYVRNGHRPHGFYLKMLLLPIVELKSKIERMPPITKP